MYTLYWMTSITNVDLLHSLHERIRFPEWSGLLRAKAMEIFTYYYPSAEKDLTDLSLDSEDSTELFITLDLTDNPDLEAYMQHEIPNLPLSMVRSDFVGSNKKTASRGGRTVSTMPQVPSTKM
jgi:hypothetical protein